MDDQVLGSQQWLNSTYGQVSGWVTLDEDGTTGWSTMYGLRRALQAELGISPVSSGFGLATTAAYSSQIGRVDTGTTSPNLLKILSACLWCKGYAGLWAGDDVAFESMSYSVGRIRDDLGLGSADPYVDVKLMASLMTMDAYTTLGSGSSAVREVQRWLNATYVHRAAFALIPCDGIYSRQVQTALLYGLQYEIGMADGTANGNFGPGTREGVRTKAQVGPGSIDGSKRFVHLYQAALRFNTYDSPFTGTFDVGTEQDTRDFQSFMELPVSGNGDYSTWCSLLVSSGDTSIATKGFDTSKQLTAVEARGAVAAGYTTVGRYTVGASKFITADELDGLRAAGLTLFPIHQRFNNEPSVMTYANGRLHGIEALERCRALGLPSDSLVFFCVDFDALGETINGPVCDYFRGVNDAMGTAITTTYQVGVYGTRNVCTTVISEGQAKAAFVAGMSTGFSGNMGFPMPATWQYNQILEISATFAGSNRTIPIDKDVVSSQATPISLDAVVSPPVERDGSSSATGFDAFFEWVVRAEVACERGLALGSNLLVPLKPYAALTSSYIAHWLQKPKYWSEGDDGLWPTYTPVLDIGQNAMLARAAAEDELAKLDPTKPASARDIAHFAATLRGYETWGASTTVNDYDFGDLGGWGLDLLQAWGKYLEALDQAPGLDLMTYLSAQIGAIDGDAGFGWNDIVADADAYLVSRAMKVSDVSISGALRTLLKETSHQRVSRFYRDRFGGSEDNVATAFSKLADGIEAGPVDNAPYTKELLMQAANALRLPSAAEALVCGRAYGRAMAAAD